MESNFKLSESQEPLIDSLKNYNILINQNKIDENDDDDESKKRFSSDLSSEDLNRSCQLLSNLVIYENEKDKDIMKSESIEPLIINDKNEFELRSIRSSKIENNINNFDTISDKASTTHTSIDDLSSIVTVIESKPNR